MKGIIRLGIFLIFTIMGLIAKADDVTFIASGPVKVSQGSQFRITYTVNAQGTNFKAPTFKNFNFIGGPSQSSSSNMQIINGQVYQSVQYSFTVYLQAVNVGKFEIDEATINVNGKVYKSNKLQIEVVAGNVAPQTQAQSQPYSQSRPNRQQQNPQVQEEVKVGSNDVFVRAIASRNSVYEGEEVKVTYKLYTAIPIVQYSIKKVPSSNGFWSTELSDRQKQPKQYQEVYEGRTYTVAEVRKVYVYPQKIGQLRIDPLLLDVVAQIKKAQQRRGGGGFWDNFFDDSFFGGGYSNVQKTVSSNAVNIQVKKLPDNAPEGFTGAVGQLSVLAKIDRTSIPANEALKLQITISGKGNLKLIDFPIINFPTDFEVYDPKAIDQTKTTDAGASGSMVFEYVVIPRNEGKYTIESDGFVYFDPAKNTYITLPIPKFEIDVTKGKGSPEGIVTNANQKEIQYIGSDIRFVNRENSNLEKNISPFFGSTLYWIFFILPFGLFGGFIMLYKKQIKKRADVIGMRNKKAGKEARKRLMKAEKLLNQKLKSEFFEELSKAIWGFAADKLMISKSDLSTESVLTAMELNNLNDLLVKRVGKVLNDCEFARFAPYDSSNLMDTLYKEAFDLIIEMDKEIKSKI